ncbi:hypothetical protein JW948_07310 [bacterium]|nr:hypothetical protein [bacterium]
MTELPQRPEYIVLHVVFRSRSGLVLKDKDPAVRDLSPYEADETVRDRAVRALLDLGFECVGPASRFGVSVKGPWELVGEVFGNPVSVPGVFSEWITEVKIPERGKYY